MVNSLPSSYGVGDVLTHTYEKRMSLSTKTIFLSCNISLHTKNHPRAYQLPFHNILPHQSSYYLTPLQRAFSKKVLKQVIR